MRLNINGKQEEIDKELTIQELLSYKKVEQPLMVTVELNGNILQRNDFNMVKIKDDDVVEFLYFMGGGSALIKTDRQR